MEGIQVITQRKDEEHTVAIEILLKSDSFKGTRLFQYSASPPSIGCHWMSANCC